MIIQDEIAAIVATMVIEGGSVSPTFMHGEQSWINLKADEITNDLIILDEPIISDDVYRQGGLLEEQYRLKMFFFRKYDGDNESSIDNSPEQHKPLIASQRESRRKFINKLSSSPAFRSFNSIRTVDVKNALNVNLSGVMLSITVIPFNETSRC